jgi:hypothetical protein
VTTDVTTDPAQPLTRRQLRDNERARVVPIPAPNVAAAQSTAPQAYDPRTFAPLVGHDQSSFVTPAPVTPTPVAPARIDPAVPPTPSDFGEFDQVRSRRPSRSALAATSAVTRPPVRSESPKSPKAARGWRRRVASKIFSTAALLFAGALLVGSSVPANAFFFGGTPQPTADGYALMAVGEQQLAVSPEDVLAGDIDRNTYKVTSAAEMLAAKYGNVSNNFEVTKGAIRWPFPYSVTTSDGFGPRAAPCGGCSTFHNGLDFLPGAGTPIYAVADGVVSFHAMDGTLGNKVVIDHVIKGQAVQSVYAHMAVDSSALQVGDRIKVGDFVGLVGSTGLATAPHLHLEIHLAGVPVNPFSWLTANAK